VIVYQAVSVLHGTSNNDLSEVAKADNAGIVANENAQGENDSEAGDEDSEDDDEDDIQVTIGDIKTTYESVLVLDELYSLHLLVIVAMNSACY